MHPIQSLFPLEGFLESRIGGRPENQDSCGFSDTPLGALIIVCDGMGGMKGGSTASSLAVSTIIASFTSASPEDEPETTIRRAISTANDVIIRTGMDNPDLQGMGTTVVLVLINKDCAYVAKVGDSRLYQLRDGKKRFRTFDDSMVFQLVKSGAITEEEARTASNSNIITKALGVANHVECEVEKLDYDKNDRFLLCSDGYWGPLKEKDLIALLTKKNRDLSMLFERSIDKVEDAAKTNRPDHYDNLTAIIFDVKCNSKFRSKMERVFKISTIVLAVLLLFSIGVIFFLLLQNKTQDQKNAEGSDSASVITKTENLPKHDVVNADEVNAQENDDNQEKK